MRASTINTIQNHTVISLCTSARALATLFPEASQNTAKLHTVTRRGMFQYAVNSSRLAPGPHIASHHTLPGYRLHSTRHARTAAQRSDYVFGRNINSQCLLTNRMSNAARKHARKHARNKHKKVPESRR
jgi:hypothetical protein